jgi:hypothetical protein
MVHDDHTPTINEMMEQSEEVNPIEVDKNEKD